MIMDILKDAVLNFFIASFQFLITCFLAVGAVFLSMKFFDNLTSQINGFKEIKKGNVAVALVMIAVVYSVINIINTAIIHSSSLFSIAFESASINILIFVILISIFNIVISILAAISSVWLTIFILDSFTTEIDEYKELKKGNVAVAIEVAGVLIIVSFMLSTAVSRLVSVITISEFMV